MTVSQALNPRAGSVRVSPETRAKIQRLAQKLNYRPNLAARQLAGGSSKIVGYILSGDPTYITSYLNTRAMIRKLERDELLEDLVKDYLDRNE